LLLVLTAGDRPVLVYDGDCAFCTRSARWVEHRVGAKATVQPWQALDLPALGLTEREVTEAAWWVDGRRRDRGHRSIGRAFIAIGGLWALVGRVILVPPSSWLARPVYALVARNRHKMPGGTDACRVDDRPAAR
jgi:predicted DCC family thiol-disulfide oxidoreductase YuxK